MPHGIKRIKQALAIVACSEGGFDNGKNHAAIPVKNAGGKQGGANKKNKKIALHLLLPFNYHMYYPPLNLTYNINILPFITAKYNSKFKVVK